MTLMKKHESVVTNHQGFSISGDKKHKLRVHELAKQLGVESRKLIPELLQIGTQVTSHLNVLAEADVQKAVHALRGQSQTKIYEKAPPKARRTPAGEATLPNKSQTGALKSREWTKEKMPVFSAAVEDPPKPEKKHILVKQRKETEYLLPLPGQPEGVLGAGPSAPLNPGSLIMKNPPSIAEPPSVFDIVCPAENGSHQQRKVRFLLMIANIRKYLAKAPSARLAIILVILCLLLTSIGLGERPVGLLADLGKKSSLLPYRVEPDPLPRTLTEEGLAARTVYMEAKLEGEDSHAREAEAWAPGAIADDRARESLISALIERSSDVDLASTPALQQLDEPLRELVLQTLAGSQQAMEQLVMRNDPRSWPPLVKALGNWDSVVRETAAETLKAMGGKEVVDLLINALEDLNPTLRLEAVGVLGAIGDARVTGSLIQTLQDRDPDARKAAAWALGAMGDNRARDSLISALGDRYSGVRLAATQALERLDEPLGALIHQTFTGSQQAMEQLVMRNDPRALPPLVKALGNWDSVVREAAAETLKALGSKEVVDLLINALEDLNPTLQREAAWILMDIGDQRAANPMIQAPGDWDPEVRRAAAWTLSKLGAH